MSLTFLFVICKWDYWKRKIIRIYSFFKKFSL